MKKKQYIATVETDTGEVVCYYNAEEREQPRTLAEWQKRVKALKVLFPNATYRIYRLQEVKNG